MTAENRPKASIIIAIYKDTEALHCVLSGLTRQTEKGLEVIVTEDGDDPAVANYISKHAPKSLTLRHLSQEDIGFRKTRAVDPAIVNPRDDSLLFLAGDCL